MIRRVPSIAWLVLLGAAFGTFLAVFWRSLPYPPVFDDFSHVIENRAIRYLLHPRIFLESEHTRSRPLPYVTFAMSYWLSGLSLSGLRAWSLALHMANSALLGLFYQRWLAPPARTRSLASAGLPRPRRSLSWGALAATAVFLLHPMAADSVIYLSARGTLLVLFFVLLALLCHARDRQTAVTWLGFLFFTLLAFLSRESAAALAPLIVVVHWLSGRRHTELAAYLWPLVLGGCFALALKASYLGAAWHGFFSIEGEVDVRTAADYLRLSLALWPRILGLMFLPGSLAIDHQVTFPASWSDPAVVAGALLWVAFAVTLWRYFKAPSRWLFPVCWFFLSLVPTNSVFPLLDPLSERHLYFALPALAWLFGIGVDALAENLPSRAGTVGAAAAVLAVLVAGDTVTLGRVLDWETASSLWLSAHRLAPDKFRIAFNAASSLVSERGDREGALRLLGETLTRQKPGAVRYEEQREGVEFLAGLLTGLAGDRGVPPRRLWAQAGLPDGFWSELVLLRGSLGKVPFAEWGRDWEDALARVKSTPLSPRAHDPAWVESSFTLLRAEALSAAGRYAEALAAYENVILPYEDTHFPYWTARERLADLYLRAGREKEAVYQYELTAYQYKVFKRFPYDLQEKLYTIFRNSGDLHRASDAIGELVRVRTDDAELRRLYASLLEKRQDRHAARQMREADFYSRRAISATDPRELLRP